MSGRHPRWQHRRHHHPQQSLQPQHLLIVGDDSVLPVIPFLASHYSQIRFVDLADLSEEQIAQIDCSQYQRLLIAYSVDTFIHEDIPEKVALLQTAQTEEAISLQPAEDTQQDAGQAVP